MSGVRAGVGPFPFFKAVGVFSDTLISACGSLNSHNNYRISCSNG